MSRIAQFADARQRRGRSRRRSPIPSPSSMRCRSSGGPSTSACSDPDQKPCRSSVLPIWTRSRSLTLPGSSTGQPRDVDVPRPARDDRGLRVEVEVTRHLEMPVRGRLRGDRARAARPSPPRCAPAAAAPRSTTTRTAMVSPPSGVAAADTRCTVSGSVARAATPPAHSMRGRRSGPRDDQDVGVHLDRLRDPQLLAHPRPAPGRPTGRRSARSAPWGGRRAPSPRRGASRSRSAPTIGARSVLLTTSRSEKVTPGPPLRGTLSPPATSMTKICTSTRPEENVAVRLSPPDSTRIRSRPVVAPRSGRRWRRGWR